MLSWKPQIFPLNRGSKSDVFCPQWHSLSKEEQAKYYELARKERLLHSKLYPGWSARDNYVSTAACLHRCGINTFTLVADLSTSSTTDQLISDCKAQCVLFLCRVKRRRERGRRVKLSLKVRRCMNQRASLINIGLVSPRRS